jgi:hypothetical protein
MVAPNPLPAGTPAPKTTVQIARQYGVNPSFLEQMVAHLRRSDGAPASVLYAWEIYGTDKPLAAWTSPTAKLFADFRPANRAALAARYQELFAAALRQWTALPQMPDWSRCVNCCLRSSARSVRLVMPRTTTQTRRGSNWQC